MKKINLSLNLIILLFIIISNVNAQVFYYSEGKKFQLQKDTSTLFINVDKTKAGQSYLNNLLSIEGVKSFDTTLGKSVVAIRLNTNADKNKVLSSIKKESRIFHAWEALTFNGIPFVATGEILLKPKSGLALQSIITNLNLKDKVLTSDSAYYGTYVLKVLNPNDLFDIANLIYESKLVDWCHPNFFVPIANYQNDPLYGQQYYLRNTGQFGGVPGIDINVEGAWNITHGGANIRVAVIDEGVEDHEDLAGRVLNGFTPRDVNGNGRPTPNWRTW